MGHLLASLNQEASDRIVPSDPVPALPDVGHIVIYHMRHGFGRQGKTRFNALVQGRGERGTLNLLVLIDAGDFIDEQFVEPAGPGQESHCWEWPDDSRNASGFRGTIAALHDRIGEIEAKNAELRACVLGEFDVPKVSIIHIMQDFETRLRSIQQAVFAQSSAGNGKSKKK